MKQILADIQSGAYAEEWIEENANGRPNFNKWRQDGMNSQVEQVGKRSAPHDAVAEPERS